MTNPTTPRAYIQELCSKNGLNDEPSHKVAQGIEATLTAFKNMGCFVNELLQNANDQAIDHQFLEVSFTLIGSELIIYHNGKPFSHENVKRICDYAGADHNEKSEKADQTGYKDIGFKSVFKVAYCVYIFSQDWRFHFNEKDPKWKTQPGENRYPWQIAPLWTEDVAHLSLTAQNILKEPGRTTFVCCLNNPAVPEVQRELLRFKNYPENILFLCKTRQVSISVDGQSFTIENRNDTIVVNDVVFNLWRRFSTSIPIPSPIKEYLIGLQPFQCPRRLQKADFTDAPISFCFPMNANEFLKNHGVRFFCSLPVGVMGDSPILVNAPFLLDLSREALIDDQWNKFLIAEIAKANFSFMRDLFKQQSRAALRTLAPNVLIGVSDLLGEVFKKQMELCQQEAFLPPQEGLNFLNVTECIVDPTGFYKQLYDARLVLPGTERFVHPDINTQDVLGRFKANTTTLDNIITLLPGLMSVHSSVDTCLLILRFFCRIFQRNNQFAPAQFDCFKGQRFVVTTRLQLVSLAEVHLPLVSKQHPVELPFCLPLHVIHPALLTDEILAWLKQIYMKPLKADTIVNYYQKSLNDLTLETRETNIQIIRMFFILFSQKEIKEGDVRLLKGIQLLTKSGKILPSNHVYLSDIFKPRFPLEKHLPNAPKLFISSDYYYNEESIQTWNKFFIALGVYDTCELAFVSRITVSTLRGIPGSYIEQYLEHVFSVNNGEYRPAKRLPKGDDYILSFAYFPWIELIKASDSFSNHFWDRILASTNAILNSFANTTYHAMNKGEQQQPITYLQYVFQHQALICDKKGKYHSSKELYAPSMEQFIGDYLPTAVLPVALSSGMEQFLGFKTKLDVEGCRVLLIELQKPECYRHESYKLALEHLLLNLRSEQDKEKITKINWSFHATDNSWQIPSKLQYLSQIRSSLPIDSPDWIKPVLGEREMEELCAFFKIKAGQKKQDQTIYQKAQACDELKEFILERIPEIAFRWAHHRGNDTPPEEYVDILLKSIASLEFYMLEEEDDFYDASEEFEPMIVDNCFYYDASWRMGLENIAITLSEHLRFVGTEATLLKDAIRTRKPRHPNNQKLFEAFEKAYQTKKEKALEAPLISPTQTTVTIDNILNEDDSSTEKIPLMQHAATSPKTVQRSIEIEIEDSKLEGEAVATNPSTPKVQPKRGGSKGPWTPKTTPDKVKDSPDREEPASKPALVEKSDTEKGFSFSNKTKSSAEKTSGRSEIDNKKLGLWAEEHVLLKKLIHKYMDKLKEFNPTEEKLGKGMRRITCDQKHITINFLWYNSPERRPVEHKDDELWDSCHHYDIEVTKIKNGVPKTRMIEVKGTEWSQIRFFLGALEWRTLLDHPDKYRIYVVTNAGSDDALVTPIKNFMQSLKEKKYLPNGSIEFRE